MRYLENNIKFIKKYESYYEEEFNIDKIKQDIINGKLDENLLDLSRFRIFLDSCVLLFNKEKLEKDYFTKAFDPKGYINSIKNNYHEIIKLIEKEFEINVGDTFYYEFNEQKSIFIQKSLWESRKILRNSFAHMQYGNFVSSGTDSTIPWYFMFNKDKGIKKSNGLVIEPLCHELISKFYLNQMTKSVAYKHTFIKSNGNGDYFVEVKYAGEEKYTINSSSHIMNNKIFSSNDFGRVDKFLQDNAEQFEIKSKLITNDEKGNYFNALSKFKNKITGNELGYFIKSIYDIETEFSNFLTHIIQLNDRLIDYRKNKNLDQAANDQIFTSIDELKEDIDSWVEFRFFFKLLYIINFSLRLEDDDLENINYKNICIDGFLYDYKQMVDFVNKKILDKTIKDCDEKYGDKIYILFKIRNAIAHGRINIEVDGSTTYYAFEDEYNKRTEKIKITVEDMTKFTNNVNDLI